MCSFGSCQTRFEFLSQFRKVRNAFECFVAQVQTQLPKTKRVWPMKINVICTVQLTNQMLKDISVTPDISVRYHKSKYVVYGFMSLRIFGNYYPTHFIVCVAK